MQLFLTATQINSNSKEHKKSNPQPARPGRRPSKLLTGALSLQPSIYHLHTLISAHNGESS